MTVLDENRIPAILAVSNTDGSTVLPVYGNAANNSISVNNAPNLINGDFSNQPSFTAETTTFNRWIDGTSGGSTTDYTYRWAITNTTSGTNLSRFDNVGGVDCITITSTGLTKSGGNIGQSSVTNIRDYSAGTVSSYNTPFMIEINPSQSYNLSGYYYIHSCSDTTNVGTNIKVVFYQSDGITRITATATSTKYGTTLNEWLPVTGTSFTAPSNAKYMVIGLTILATGSDGVGREMKVSYSDIVITESLPSSSLPDARDSNRKVAFMAVSSVDGITPVEVYVDATTNKLLINSN